MSPPSDKILSPGRIWQVILLSSLLVVATLVVASLQSSRLFDAALRPDLQSKAETLSETVALQFRRAVELGIPLSRLRGVDAFLDATAAGHKELRYIAFTSPEGRLLFSSRGLKDQPPDFFERLQVAHASEQEHRLTRIGGVLDLAFPVLSQGHPIGQLYLGIDATYIEQRLQEIYTDIIITLFVTALVTIEVLLALMGLLVDRPVRLLHRLFELGSAGDFTRQVRTRLRDEASRALVAGGRLVRALNERYAALVARADLQRSAGRLGQAAEAALAGLEQRFHFSKPGSTVALEEPETGDLRLPLFVYLFGSELSRSFWPLFVKRLYQPVPYFSESFMVALPMSLWVTAMVLFTPLAGRLLRRRGSRTALLVGMVPSAVGLAMTGLSSSMAELFFWRVVTACGYGIVTTTVLIHVARTARKGQGARSMGVFVGASTAASVCGTAIGGILADRIGYGETFLVATALVCLAMALVGLLTPDTEPRAAEEAPPSMRRAYVGLFLRGRVLLFILLASVPIRLVLTGFLFYLTPLRLHSIGFGEAAIGRMMMGYFICTVLTTPVVSLLADRYGGHRMLMLLGGLFSGLGVLLFSMSERTWTLLAAVMLVGLGQALATTPLLASVPLLFEEECTRFGLDALLSVFRITERVGSLIGPLAAAVLLGASGFVASSHAIGIGVLVLTAGLAAFFLFFRFLPPPSSAARVP